MPGLFFLTPSSIFVFLPLTRCLLLFLFCSISRSFEQKELSTLLTAQLAPFPNLLLEKHFLTRPQRAITLNTRSMDMIVMLSKPQVLYVYSNKHTHGP